MVRTRPREHAQVNACWFGILPLRISGVGSRTRGGLVGEGGGGVRILREGVACVYCEADGGRSTYSV